jgi:hypothetical protein
MRKAPFARQYQLVWVVHAGYLDMLAISTLLSSQLSPPDSNMRQPLGRPWVWVSTQFLASARELLRAVTVVATAVEILCWLRVIK